MKIDKHCFEVKETKTVLKFFYLGANSPILVRLIIFVLILVYFTKLSNKLILPIN